MSSLLARENNELWGASISSRMNAARGAELAPRSLPRDPSRLALLSPLSFPFPSSISDDLKIGCIPFLLSLAFVLCHVGAPRVRRDDRMILDVPRRAMRHRSLEIASNARHPVRNCKPADVCSVLYPHGGHGAQATVGRSVCRIADEKSVERFFICN